MNARSARNQGFGRFCFFGDANLSGGGAPGVPAPRRLTPCKESALRVIALMRRQGSITSKQIADHGIGTGYWTQPYGERKAWLAKGPVRGQWVETEHMPPFDKQHPEAYTLVLQELANSLQGEFTLT